MAFFSMIYKIFNFIRLFFIRIYYLYKTSSSIQIIIYFIFDNFTFYIYKNKFKNDINAFKSSIKNLSLSNDWFTDNLPFWFSIFKKNFNSSDAKIYALEIGSWEGLSSYFILSNLKYANLTCVDTWEGADEHKLPTSISFTVLSQIENKFDTNLSSFSDSLTKYKGTSFGFYVTCINRNIYDFIYVDGSHHSEDVIIDAFKCFELLKINGIMIFDDYLWEKYTNPLDNPASAINAFLKIKKGSYKVISVNYQIAIMKTKDRDINF